MPPSLYPCSFCNQQLNAGKGTKARMDLHLEGCATWWTYYLPLHQRGPEYTAHFRTGMSHAQHQKSSFRKVLKLISFWPRDRNLARGLVGSHLDGAGVVSDNCPQFPWQPHFFPISRSAWSTLQAYNQFLIFTNDLSMTRNTFPFSNIWLIPHNDGVHRDSFAFQINLVFMETIRRFK